MKKWIWAISVLAMWAGQGQAAEKINAAVSDFEAGNEVSPALAASVSDFIQSGLVQSGRFNMIDRKNMENVLKEQGFQKSGCTTAECAVEIGKLLNVKNMIVGNISKVGRRYVISIRLLSVETGKTDLSDDVECDSQEVIREASLKLADHFSRSIEFQGKVLSVDKDGKVGSEIVIDLGSQVNVDDKTKFQIKRLEKVVGKFTKYTVIGEAEAKEVQSEGSSAIVKKVVHYSKVKITENDREKEVEVGVKVDDVAVFVESKLAKKLDPVLTKGGVQNYPPNDEPVSRKTKPAAQEAPAGGGDRGRLSIGSAQAADYLKGTESASGIPSAKIKVGQVGQHAVFGMEFGWTSSPALDFGFPMTFEMPDMTTVPITFGGITIPGTKIPNVNLMTFGFGLIGRLFPFSMSSESGDRGVFRPYISGGGMVLMGLYDPDTTSSTIPMSFMFGFGGTAAVGAELGPIFFEVFMRPGLSLDAKYKATTTSTTFIVEQFLFGSPGGQIGLRW